MKPKFIELKTTEGTPLWIKPEALTALEPTVASQRSEAHVKIYIDGFKFLIAEDKEQIMKKLEAALQGGN